MPDEFPRADLDTVSTFYSGLNQPFTQGLPTAQKTVESSFTQIFQPNGLQGVWATSHNDTIAQPINKMLQHFNEAAAALTATLDAYHKGRSDLLSIQNIQPLADHIFWQLEIEIPIESTLVCALVATFIPIPVVTTVAGAIVGAAAGLLVDAVMGYLNQQGDFVVYIRDLLAGTEDFDWRYDLLNICKIFDDPVFNDYRQQFLTLERNVMRDVGHLKTVLDQQTSQWDQLAQSAQSSAAAPTFPVTTH